jgi:hypothetical protein
MINNLAEAVLRGAFPLLEEGAVAGAAITLLQLKFDCQCSSLCQRMAGCLDFTTQLLS